VNLRRLRPNNYYEVNFGEDYLEKLWRFLVEIPENFPQSQQARAIDLAKQAFGLEMINHPNLKSSSACWANLAIIDPSDLDSKAEEGK